MAVTRDEDSVDAPRWAIAPKIRAALVMLLEAHDYAMDAGQDVWDFAVELAWLRAAGLNNSDLRWLARRGYAGYAREVTPPGREKRQFSHTEFPGLTKDTCLVLTEAGVELARRVAAAALAPGPSEGHTQVGDGSGSSTTMVPHWDPSRRVLRVGDAVVKRLRRPAPSQESVLSAFQEQSWPHRIDDPLSPEAETDPKRRLHAVVYCLNRNQKNRRIRFRGDGTGTGVCWELL